MMKLNTVVCSAVLASTMLLAAPVFATEQSIAVDVTIKSYARLTMDDGSNFTNIDLKWMKGVGMVPGKYSGVASVVFASNDMTNDIMVKQTNNGISKSGAPEKYQIEVDLGGKKLVSSGTSYSSSDYASGGTFTPMNFSVKVISKGELPVGIYSGTIALDITQNT